MQAVQTVRRFLRADDGKLSKVIEYGTGARVEIPINRDGSVRWYVDKPKEKKG